MSSIFLKILTIFIMNPWAIAVPSDSSSSELYTFENIVGPSFISAQLIKEKPIIVSDCEDCEDDCEENDGCCSILCLCSITINACLSSGNSVFLTSEAKKLVWSQIRYNSFDYINPEKKPPKFI